MGRLPRVLVRLVGLLWVGHPGPSVLTGVVAGSVGILAGAEADVALRLFLAMTALQLAIGATNDLVDAERDALSGRRKPIPLGLVGRTTAAVVAGGTALVGLVVAASLGPAVFGLAVLGLGLGLGYDLRLRSLGLGWLAFALAIPLVPIFGWFGGSGSLPGPVLFLALAAVPAGLGLAISNGLPDLGSDALTGTPSLARRLGSSAPRLAALADLLALLVVLGGIALFGGGGVGLGLVAVGIGLVGIGLSLPARSRAWEVQAIGLAIVALGWLSALRHAGTL